MLRDKRSHTDQQTEGFCCSTLMHTAVYLQIQIIYVMEFQHNYVSTLSHTLFTLTKYKTDLTKEALSYDEWIFHEKNTFLIE